jgi:hypothetical protein
VAKSQAVQSTTSLIAADDDRQILKTKSARRCHCRCRGRSLHSAWYSNWTARTPRTVLGLSSDYSWLRGLPKIYCESELVQRESEQSPSDYSESLDSLRTRLRTESDHVQPR